ncbi:uncharacterized protein LOC127000628 [Eriocheir sinensis]|uniref:uncharacterized protein LOC127000628 n=1 Tax=Eriocheir sinensis TaxID=95602 RepID=UPI0021C674CC|nr:uncharacterized protein LOC127000628 [Eriocheir sinensis]
MAATSLILHTSGPAMLPPHQPLLYPPGPAFLPLAHSTTLLQQARHHRLPPPRPRALAGFTSGSSSSLPAALQQHLAPPPLTDLRLQELLGHHDRLSPPTTATTTTTTTPSTTTTTAAPSTTTPAAGWAGRGGHRFVSQFHAGPLSPRGAGGGGADDGVVLLVGLFNLLAVVVYAAHRHLTGAAHGLSARVIQWQVQQVLDDLVIKVHSSAPAANMLARALPAWPPEPAMPHGRAAPPAPTPWLPLLLGQARALLLHQDPAATRWLEQVQRRLTQEVAATPAALRTTTLRPEVYRPLQDLYAALASGKAATALEAFLTAAEGGRDLNPRPGAAPHVRGLLDGLANLTPDQLRATLATLTALGRAQQRLDVLPALGPLLAGRAAPVTARVRARRAAPRSRSSGRRQRRVMRRQGVVVPGDAAGAAGEAGGHWTDRWFSLVTQAAPVGLDMSTLYARARARPACLRALLCRANNAWRQVGPLQAALTPFTSVALSWVLEDAAPHSLGDSLIAVRAGWMGKPCSSLYPECPLHPDPHPAAKEAITFFSRLQFAATQPPPPPPPAAEPKHSLPTPQQQQQQQQESNTIEERIDITNFTNPHTAASSYPSYPPHIPSYTYPPHTLEAYPSVRVEGGGGGEKEDNTAASFHAYYNRYEGEGPVSVPGAQYNTKYTYGKEDRYKKKEEEEDEEDEDNWWMKEEKEEEKEEQDNWWREDVEKEEKRWKKEEKEEEEKDMHWRREEKEEEEEEEEQDRWWRKEDRYRKKQKEEEETAAEKKKEEEEEEENKRRRQKYKNSESKYKQNEPSDHHHQHYQPQQLSNHLYEKYDSPDLPSGTDGSGGVLASGSVSGMALQDPPTPNTAHTWEQMFKAGLFGTSVAQKTAGGGTGGTGGGSTTGAMAGRPREHPHHHPYHPQQQQHTTTTNNGHTAMQKIPYQPQQQQQQHTTTTSNGNTAIQNIPYHPQQQHTTTTTNGHTAMQKIGTHGNNHQYHQSPPPPPPPNTRPSPSRPFFSLRPHQYAPVKKYRYGLRRGLPAGNVNNNKNSDTYSILKNDVTHLHRPQKPWYSYTARPDTYSTYSAYSHFRPRTTSTTAAPPSTTTATPTTTTTTSKAVAQFGPEDAVTDILRNELLYEYVRDRKISVHLDKEEEEDEERSAR